MEKNENGLLSRPVKDAELEGMVDRAGLYAIVDACDEPIVFEEVQKRGPDRALCLHGGDLDEDERRIAPYLIRVDAETLRWIRQELWGRPWGIFLISDHDERVLRPHLRRMLSVEGPEGEPMYLRYFDPRLTGSLLEELTPEQAEQMMSMVKAFLVPPVPVESGHHSMLFYRGVS